MSRSRSSRHFSGVTYITLDSQESGSLTLPLARDTKSGTNVVFRCRELAVLVCIHALVLMEVSTAGGVWDGDGGGKGGGGGYGSWLASCPFDCCHGMTIYSRGWSRRSGSI